MTLSNRNDAILIKMIIYEDGKEKMISAYYTTAIDQTLKMFQTAKDNDIEIQHNHVSYYVNDIILHFGDSTEGDLPVIEIIAE